MKAPEKKSPVMSAFLVFLLSSFGSNQGSDVLQSTLKGRSTVGADTQNQAFDVAAEMRIRAAKALGGDTDSPKA